MRFACFVFAGALLAQAPQNPAPLYVESSIVNAASSKVEGLAPNTLATLYGRHLAWTTRALNADDVRGGVVPTALGGAGVRVLVNRVEAPLLFVSPGQVNFLVPSELTPGTAEVRLSLDGRYGPAVYMRLSEATPALFQWDPEFIVAVRADGSAVTHASPAKPGEVVVLYATGLGPLRPQPESGQITRGLARLARISEFRVEIDGVELPPEAVSYAGAAPGYPGLYQVNCKLPDVLPDNPTIRINASGTWSQAGARISAKR
jgi:uncharacterized protein (TIGR03437 family)